NPDSRARATTRGLVEGDGAIGIGNTGLAERREHTARAIDHRPTPCPSASFAIRATDRRLTALIRSACGGPTAPSWSPGISAGGTKETHEDDEGMKSAVRSHWFILALVWSDAEPD